MITPCVEGDEGWYGVVQIQRYDFCRGCGSNASGSYEDVENTDIYIIKRPLNNIDKNTIWNLKTIITPNIPGSGIGFRTELIAESPGLSDITIWNLIDSDRLLIDSRLTRETLLDYEFIFCGDEYCCCCPEEMQLPSIIESKLK